MSGGGVQSRRLSIIVVAYHAADSLKRCLHAVSGVGEITVVDNSCSSAVREVAETAGVAYLDPGRNLGFGAGVNVALRRIVTGSPSDVLLLNPDAELRATEALRLVARLHAPQSARIAALSPSLLGVDGRPQRVMWPFPSPWRAWLEAAGFGRLNRREDFAVGAVLLLRWEALREVGLFDEQYFLYAEETDWQRRARGHGWLAGVADDISAKHVGGGSSSDERRRAALFHAGGETYQRKWHGVVGWQLYRAAVLVGCLPRIATRTGSGRVAARLRLSLYARGPRRAAGLDV